MKLSIPKIKQRARETISERTLRTWERSGEGLDYPDQVRASSVLRESMEKRIYQLPDF